MWSRGWIAGAALAMAGAANAGVGLEPVASGFKLPLYVTHAGDGSGRIFVVEKAGVVRIVSAGAVRPTPFVDLRAIVGSTGGEQGLLGMAFHPDYPHNGAVFVSYTDKNGDSAIARYRVRGDDPNALDVSSAQVILTLDQPYSNHNGGGIAFGPDGYLYVGFGDGGSGGDPHGNGQNTLTLLGDLLRIDVNVPTGYAIPLTNPHRANPFAKPEIWASGLRNPWRFSFDRETGDLWIGDVGQYSWEEIDFQPAASPGGENYGWDFFEGDHPYQLMPPETPPDTVPPETVPPLRFVFPVAEYDHSEGCSVIGGYVYRGAAVPSLSGAYVFSDVCSGTMWTLRPGTAGPWTRSEVLQTKIRTSSFGEDEAGELYVTDFYAGTVSRFVER
ncbi:MAG: hypothetical protein QOD06_159 [Candidatus Binatota bacterium]|nr:hypothetical protein [Candidatus Binatota bacterium]